MLISTFELVVAIQRHPMIILTQIFHDAGMDRILQKQFLLTGFLEHLLLKNFSDDNDSTKIEILTPRDFRWRGCQLSLVFNTDVGQVHKLLEENGVVVSDGQNVQAVGIVLVGGSF